jgi:hypothetical protein
LDPLLTLNPTRLAVDPGGEVRAQVTVRNPGEIVEQYRLQILGESARWSQTVPRDVSVLPGKTEEALVQIVFRPPPAPAAPAGEIPFGIRCVSLDRQDNCSVVEGDVVVSAVLDLQAELVPVGATGRRKGRYRLELRNTGTLPITVRVGALDDAELLRFAVAPTELTVEAREARAVYIAIRPRTANVFGKPIDHTVVVTYEVPETERAGELQTVFSQRALIRKWMIVVAGLLAVVALLVLAVFVLRPGAESGPTIEAGRPPGIVDAPSVTTLGPDKVQLQWQPNPFALSYELQMLRNSTRIQSTTAAGPPFDWEGLSGSGESCFRILPRNGELGSASDPSCVQLQGAAEASASEVAASEQEASASAESEAAASAASAASASEASRIAEEEASKSAQSEAEQTATPSAPSDSASQTTTTAVVQVPRQFWVTYYITPKGNDATFQRARQIQATLTSLGRPAELVDNTQLPPEAGMQNDVWIVYSDNFASAADAQTECSARNNVIQDVICVVEEPVDR